MYVVWQATPKCICVHCLQYPSPINDAMLFYSLISCWEDENQEGPVARPAVWQLHRSLCGSGVLISKDEQPCCVPRALLCVGLHSLAPVVLALFIGTV